MTSACSNCFIQIVTHYFSGWDSGCDLEFYSYPVLLLKDLSRWRHRDKYKEKKKKQKKKRKLSRTLKKGERIIWKIKLRWS
jgi:hypothetical protein